MQLCVNFKVSIHPSHSVMIPQLGEDEADILGQVNPPIFFTLSSSVTHNHPPLAQGEISLCVCFTTHVW